MSRLFPYRAFITLLVVSVIAVNCTKTGMKANSTSPVELAPMMRLGEKHDAYFTWRDYDGLGGRFDDVFFVWNGAIVGQGRNGFLEILNRLERLSEKSIVLSYPSYVTWNDGYPPYRPPYDQKELGEVLKKKRLILWRSCYDHEGKYVGATRNSLRIDYSKPESPGELYQKGESGSRIWIKPTSSTQRSD